MPDAFLHAEDGVLLCPRCGSEWTHVDVFVAGRPREDSAVVPVHVESSGRVQSDIFVALPQTLVALREPQWAKIVPMVATD